MKPAPLYPGRVAVLPPQLFGSVAYYALMARYGAAYVDNELRYDKRFKSVHRFDIASTRGRISLTVPVSRPEGATRWCDVKVSAHGRWWETMPDTLATAYGRTPFFEFYIDRLMPVFSEPTGQSITELCDMADSIVRSTLGICTRTQEAPAADCADSFLRKGFEEYAPSSQYWQVRGQELGFIPGLSILDLLFNLGPEAAIFLTKN